MNNQQKILKKIFIIYLSIVMAVTGAVSVHAQTGLHFPVPGTMVTTSIEYQPPLMAGMTIYPDNPLKLDFFISNGEDDLQGEAFQKEAQKLINYFFAALAVPDEEMWVNLSPYEKDRIIADHLGKTEMGRDMLVQDYMLKQLAASLLYPEEDLGEAFWKKIYEKSYAKFGTTEIPMNTFNKVWIVPEEAVVFVNGTNVFVSETHLKVMLEEDYLALEANQGRTTHGLGEVANDTVEIMNEEVKKVIKEMILPEIEKEVNEGKNFANLRQIYHSMILATWYKQNLQESVLGFAYNNRNKVDGIDLEDKDIKTTIYQQYIAAFEKGVYDFIKEDYDVESRQEVPRRYFSGGLKNATVRTNNPGEQLSPNAVVARGQRGEVNMNQVTVDGDLRRIDNPDAAMLVKPLSQRLDPEEYQQRVHQYLERHQLIQYAHIRDLFTPQIMDVLLEQPVLKPVFMVHLTEEAGDVGPLEDIDDEAVAKIGGVATLNKFTAFKIGDAAAADEAAANGQALMIGVTDRRTAKRRPWSGSEMANQRQTFFPLDDGTWLGVKGSGDHWDDDQSVGLAEEEFIFLRGLATRGEVNDFIQSRKEVLAANPGKVRTVKFLAYRKINKLFRDNGRPISADQLAQKHPKRPYVDWDYSPILIFNHVASPYRLSKFFQLAEHDEHLTHLLHHVQNAYTAMGEEPPISVQQMFDQTLKGMALNQAGKQNLLLWKKTYHIQDVAFFWGEEADHEEWKNYQEIFTWLAENEQYAFPPLDLRFFIKYKIKLAEIRAVLQAAQWIVNFYRAMGKLEEFISSPRQLLKMVFQTYFHQLDDQYLIPWLIESDQLEVDGKRYVLSKVLQKFFAKNLWRGFAENPTGDETRDAVAVMLDVQGWLNQEAASRGWVIDNIDELDVIQIVDISREETLVPMRDFTALVEVNDDRVVRRALAVFDGKGLAVSAKGDQESVREGYVELVMKASSLSDENRQIIDELIVASADGPSISVRDEGSLINMRYQVNENTVVQEVAQWFTALAYLFHSQKKEVAVQVSKHKSPVMDAAPEGFFRVDESPSRFRSPAGYEIVGFQVDGNAFSSRLPNGKMIVFQSVVEKSDGLTGDIVGHQLLSERLLGRPYAAIHVSSVKRIEFIPKTGVLKITHDRAGDGHFVTEEFLPDGTVQETQHDMAMITNAAENNLQKGGIDLNPAILNLAEQGSSVNFTVDHSMLQYFQVEDVDGIIPKIITIVPVTNFMPLVGLSEQ